MVASLMMSSDPIFDRGLVSSADSNFPTRDEVLGNSKSDVGDLHKKKRSREIRGSELTRVSQNCPLSKKANIT